MAPSADSMCHTTFVSCFLQLCLGMYRPVCLACNTFICSLLSSFQPQNTQSQVEALMGAQNGQQNSNGERAPASMVPFLQAPCSSGLAGPSSNGSSKGGSQGGSGVSVKGGSGGGSGMSNKGGSAGGCGGGSPSAKQAGSGGSQSHDILAEGLAQLAHRDWELNLDALEVSAASHTHRNQLSLGCSTAGACRS